MVERNVDNLISTLIGKNYSRDLSELEIQFVLIQSACTMALEGTTRASSSQIAAKVFQDYQIEVTPSFTGQTFANLSIHSVTSHGKNKLVLDPDQLENLRNDIASKCKEAMDRLQASIKKYKYLPQKIEELQKEWKQVLAARAKEQELIRIINEDRRNPPRLDYLETEYRKKQRRNEYINQIKEEAKKLALKEKKLPSLEERTKAVEARIAEHGKHVRDLVEKEREISAKEQEAVKKEESLARRLEKLQKRLGWLELAALEQHIEESRNELKELSKQLGEKRSLLDRLLHKREGGSL
jgi:DNA repair exonuclease SbcCD ATPase subunit